MGWLPPQEEKGKEVVAWQQGEAAAKVETTYLDIIQPCLWQQNWVF